MSNVVINEKEELVKLDNIRIRDREMVPEYSVVTNKVLETQTDPQGNVIGYINRLERLSSITLRPEEHYDVLKTRKKHAKENGTKTKETGKKKGTNGKT